MDHFPAAKLMRFVIYLGTLPFVLFLGNLVLKPDWFLGDQPIVLAVYASSIFCFVVGMIWGFLAGGKAELSPGAQKRFVLWAVFGNLVAWSSVTFITNMSLLMAILGAVYFMQMRMEWVFAHVGLMPEWFVKMRKPPMVVSWVSLFVAAWWLY